MLLELYIITPSRPLYTWRYKTLYNEFSFILHENYKSNVGTDVRTYIYIYIFLLRFVRFRVRIMCTRAVYKRYCSNGVNYTL